MATRLLMGHFDLQDAGDAYPISPLFLGVLRCWDCIPIDIESRSHTHPAGLYCYAGVSGGRSDIGTSHLAVSAGSPMPAGSLSMASLGILALFRTMIA